ncbi:VWA domain-containing protein [Embleya sp. NBC_00888]|uniref:VWA domain-containing protein n=1 Tax=Embleya sp. NBC_00888 TaxID=2975960 RepID=UPI00386DCF3C|nr:VWA domain-containing protein [Embleya sp. NBC_00888]
MGLRSLLRNVFRSRASREAAETPETTDVTAAPTDLHDTPTESPVDVPEPVAESAPKARPEPAVRPEPAIVPEPPAVRDSAVSPEPEAVSEPVAVPEPEAIPEPVVIAESVVVSEPVVIAEPVVVSEPVVIPESRAEFDTSGSAQASIAVPAQSIATPVETEPSKPEAEIEKETEQEPVVTPAVEAEVEIEAAVPASAEDPADVEVAAEPFVVAEAAAVPTTIAVVPPARAEEAAPGLGGRAEAAAAAVGKCGLTGRNVAVYLVLDRSGSMRSYYKDGTVQHLADQTLALSAQLGEAVVPLVFFSTDIDGVADLDPTNHVGRIEELHGSYGHMGRTNYHWAIAKVVEHYRASGSTDPALVIFQTDGAPTSRPAAAKALCDAAGLPIFWQFIGFGDPEAKGFDFLRKLDELSVPEQRVVDNAGFFHAGQDPRLLADAELYDQLLLEFPEWLNEAVAAGVLTADPVDALV